jgi:hypothetical protein
LPVVGWKRELLGVAFHALLDPGNHHTAVALRLDSETVPYLEPGSLKGTHGIVSWWFADNRVCPTG